MQDRWYRMGDLYEPLKTYPKGLKLCPCVNFYNDHPKAIIKKMEVEWVISAEELSIEITVRENYQEYYENIYKDFFKKPPTFYLYLKSVDDVNRLRSVFQALNKEKISIPESMIKEIEFIFFFTQKLNWVNHDVNHMLAALETYENCPTISDSTPRVNLDYDNLFRLSKKYAGHFPEAKHTIEFFNHYNQKPEFELDMHFDEKENDNPILKMENDVKCTQKALRLFAEGKNPNSLVRSEGFRDCTMLMLAMKTRRPLLFQAALAYGAIPDLIGDFLLFKSPLEELFRFKPYRREQVFVNKVFDILQSVYTVLTKPISLTQEKENKRTAVSLINIEIIPGSIYTELLFSDKKVISTWFEKGNNYVLPKNEFDLNGFLYDLYYLWQQFFEMPSPYETFRSLFTKNKFVEQIYFGSTLIGFNFFELCKTKNSDHIICHIMYSGMLSEYRGYRLSSFLIYRPSFALQKLYPSKNISVFFAGISADSFMTAKHLEGIYPMYYTETTHHDMETTILPSVFKQEEKLYTNEKSIQCYIEDDTSVREEKSLAKSNPYKSLVEEGFMNLKPGEKKNRAVPVHFFLNLSNQKKLTNTVNTGLSVDYNNHVTHFSRFFSLLAKHDLDDTVPFVAPRSKL